ncbi:MAG TPA: hypothetical protein VLL52_04475 [Anaerolineae bacterium]|nr:hypothetical protein [Anaerolineae bacterium]
MSNSNKKSSRKRDSSKSERQRGKRNRRRRLESQKGENEEQSRSGRSARRQKPRKSRSRVDLSRGKEKEASYQDLVNAFVSCPRCSHFLMGYRVLFGLDYLAAAAEEIDDNQLVVAGNAHVRRLLYKAYGHQVDALALYYAGSCPHCRRAYTYQVDSEPPEIEIEEEVKEDAVKGPGLTEGLEDELEGVTLDAEFNFESDDESQAIGRVRGEMQQLDTLTLFLR